MRAESSGAAGVIRRVPPHCASCNGRCSQVPSRRCGWVGTWPPKSSNSGGNKQSLRGGSCVRCVPPFLQNENRSRRVVEWRGSKERAEVRTRSGFTRFRRFPLSFRTFCTFSPIPSWHKGVHADSQYNEWMVKAFCACAPVCLCGSLSVWLVWGVV